MQTNRNTLAVCTEHSQTAQLLRTLQAAGEGTPQPVFQRKRKEGHRASEYGLAQFVGQPPPEAPGANLVL